MDGGIVENFAIDYYDSDGKLNDKTLGLCLESTEDTKKIYNVDSILELIEGIEETESKKR